MGQGGEEVGLTVGARRHADGYRGRWRVFHAQQGRRGAGELRLRQRRTALRRGQCLFEEHPGAG